MKVKATVILDVQGVRTWEEAYVSVRALAHGRGIHAWDIGKYHAAYLEDVIQMEGVGESPTTPPGTGAMSDG